MQDVGDPRKWSLVGVLGRSEDPTVRNWDQNRRGCFNLSWLVNA